MDVKKAQLNTFTVPKGRERQVIFDLLLF